MTNFLSLRRLLTIIRKEAVQMRRDRITFAMMLGVPLMQLMLFGFAINNDPKGLPAALVAPAQDRYSRALVSALELTGYYRFTHPQVSAAEGERLIATGQVSFVVTVPSDFGRKVMRGEHPQILIEADATDPAVASGAIGTLGTVGGGTFEVELSTVLYERDTLLTFPIDRITPPRELADEFAVLHTDWYPHITIATRDAEVRPYLAHSVVQHWRERGSKAVELKLGTPVVAEARVFGMS